MLHIIFLLFDLSNASACQFFTPTPPFVNDLYKLRPYVNSGAAMGRLVHTHKDNIFLGSQSKSILATWPAQCSCLLVIQSLIFLKFKRLNNSSLLTLKL